MLFSAFAVLLSPASAESAFRIVGGVAARAGAWPDIAAVYFGDTVGCTGTLVAADLVLTAGHCARGISKVKLGITDLDESGELIDVEEVIDYPDWRESYDVALLVLKEPSSVTPRLIARDCTVQAYGRDGATVVIAGFGANDVWGRRYDSTLREADIAIVDADCSDVEHGCKRSIAPDGELRAGGDGIDACFGDSGGPLYLPTAEGDLLLGVTSRGYETSDIPCSEGGIYVRADRVAEWIEAETGELLEAVDCPEPERAREVAAHGAPEADATAPVRACGVVAAGGAPGVLAVAAALLFRRSRSGSRRRLAPRGRSPRRG